MPSKQRKAETVLQQANQVTAAVREQLSPPPAPARIGAQQVGDAIANLLRIYDKENAGFGRAPKFPQPVFLQFLIEVSDSIEDPSIRAATAHAVRHTLDRMATGGMNDQIGGGFHRYSVDDKWLVPHFEKMLYDNAMLAAVYARSFAQTGDAFDARIARRTLEFVLREMTHPGGAFFSAQDAEVNHREGQNYLWTADQLVATLGPDDGAFASRVLGVDRGPNFRDPHHPGDPPPPANVLFLTDRTDGLAQELGVPEPELLARLDAINARLLVARSTRDQPGLDDKVLTAWNGLMIEALADAGASLGEPRYLEAGERAAAFILAHLVAPDGSLRRSWRAGEARGAAFLEDHAMLARGLIALHRARLVLGRPPADHLEAASGIVGLARAQFTDPARPGVWFDTREGQPDLFVRTSATYDGAIPSGASVMLHALIDLYELTGERRWLDEALASLGALSRAIADSPIGSVNATRALLRLLRIDAPGVAAVSGARARPEVVRVEDSPVTVFAPGERLTVTMDADAPLPVELRIAPGFHIAASDPGIEGLAGLSVRVEGGKGVEVRAAFPPGTPYEGEALPEEERGRLLVYTGSVRVELLLRRTPEPWSGRPIVVITFQPCDESACFQPISVELDVALDPG